jgi:hypothetical protein
LRAELKLCRRHKQSPTSHPVRLVYWIWWEYSHQSVVLGVPGVLRPTGAVLKPDPLADEAMLSVGAVSGQAAPAEVA